ncbi:hypothetical protein NOCA2320008 [metagenome]|uniref:Uncharacterized protein n=1 Tax=metagenome TaxID=256318 RepID=A0A2P2C2L8_9ZZZZ
MTSVGWADTLLLHQTLSGCALRNE